jgi:hypothetical protein
MPPDDLSDSRTSAPPTQEPRGATTAEEHGVIGAIAGMLARPDFLIPIVAAERQFREHYYGLNSAALLEDLFFDALGNYLRQTEPDAVLLRPPTGQKGWDYTFNGLNVSHKVSQKVDVIAAIWDATLKGITQWSFNDPIVYVLSGNNPATSVLVEVDGQLPLACRAVSDLGKPFLADGRALLVVEWPAGSRVPRVLDLVETVVGQQTSDALPFSRVWRHVAEHIRGGGAANEIDVLVTNSRPRPITLEAIRTAGLPAAADVSVPYRGGVYLFPRALLQDLAVTSNNRAVLIPKPTIQELLAQARELGLSTPLPLWYTVYAQERPPDMYSAQRAEYGSRFSARGDLDG